MAPVRQVITITIPAGSESQRCTFLKNFFIRFEKSSPRGIKLRGVRNGLSVMDGCFSKYRCSFDDGAHGSFAVGRVDVEDVDVSLAGAFGREGDVELALAYGGCLILGEPEVIGYVEIDHRVVVEIHPRHAPPVRVGGFTAGVHPDLPAGCAEIFVRDVGDISSGIEESVAGGAFVAMPRYRSFW